MIAAGRTVSVAFVATPTWAVPVAINQTLSLTQQGRKGARGPRLVPVKGGRMAARGMNRSRDAVQKVQKLTRVTIIVPGTFSLASLWRHCYSPRMADGRDRVSTLSTEGADDRALLRAVAARDKDALRQLYARHSAVLFALALRVLSDRAEAEDVLQEAFVQVWKTAGSFDDGRGKPIGWLIMLTRSRAIDRLRSRKTRARVAESLAGEPSQAADSTTPADDAAASERQQTVRDALKSLPQEQRVPIELAYFGGLTQFEIAQQLSQPLGTVKTRMRNGMMRLREQLGGAGREDPSS